MQIFNELLQGTRTFHVSDDGTETFTDRPPTAKEMRTVRGIYHMHLQLEDLAKKYVELEQEHLGLIQYNNAVVSQLSLLRAEFEAMKARAEVAESKLAATAQSE